MSHRGRRHIHHLFEPPSSSILQNMIPFLHDRRGAGVSQDDLPISPISVATVDDDWHSANETLYEDEPAQELIPEDTIIALMGLTGSGKSTFINTITGKENLAPVGHKLLSCTQEIETYIYQNPRDGRRIVFVDTPGFDDTNISDLIILRMVTEWLVKTYSEKCRLSGVIFFHRISDNRMGRTAVHLIDLLRALCGNTSLANVILVTSMWDELKDDAAEDREKHLKALYWAHMLSHGARTARHNRTYESCHKIVDLIRHSPREKTTLLIQHEMCDKQLSFDATSVAATLRKRLTELVKSLTELIRTLDGQSSSSYTQKEQEEREEKKRALFVKQIKCISPNSHANKVRGWPFHLASFKRPTTRRRSNNISTDDYDVISQSDLLPSSPLTPVSATSSASKLSSASFDLYFGVYTSLDESIKVLYKISESIGLADSHFATELVKAIGVSLNVARALKKVINVDRDIIALIGRVSFFMRAVWDCQDEIDEGMSILLRHLLENLEHLEAVATQASSRRRLLRLAVPHKIRPIITKCHEYITLGCKSMNIENIDTQDTNIARLEQLIQRMDQAADRMEANLKELDQRSACACLPSSTTTDAKLMNAK